MTKEGACMKLCVTLTLRKVVNRQVTRQSRAVADIKSPLSTTLPSSSRGPQQPASSTRIPPVAPPLRHLPGQWETTRGVTGHSIKGFIDWGSGGSVFSKSLLLWVDCLCSPSLFIFWGVTESVFPSLSLSLFLLRGTPTGSLCVVFFFGSVRFTTPRFIHPLRHAAAILPSPTLLDHFADITDTHTHTHTRSVTASSSLTR